MSGRNEMNYGYYALHDYAKPDRGFADGGCIGRDSAVGTADPLAWIEDGFRFMNRGERNLTQMDLQSLAGG